MDWGNPLNKSTVPNITKVALVSCNQNSPCLMTTVLPSARGDRDECVCACVYAQLCLTPCDPIDCSPPDSSVHGISQARILEWVSSSFSRGSSPPSDRTRVSGTSRAGSGKGFFTTVPPGKPHHHAQLQKFLQCRFWM